MVNTISLSSNMENLYFSTSTGTAVLDLDGSGVNLSLDGTGNITAEAALGTVTGSDLTETTVDSQWTLTYNEDVSVVFFVGIQEVDVSRIVIDHPLDLKDKFVNIRRLGDELVIVSKPI